MHIEYKPLTGRNVLLIGIGFYDYELAIADELRRQGATVFLYDELPSYLRRGAIASFWRRFKVDVQQKVTNHHKKILGRISAYQIDYVLIIKGEHINAWFLDALRMANPRVQLISYQWDSLVRYPHLVGLQDRFDRVYTFDYADAKRFPGFKFRPLFYRPEISECRNAKSSKKFDLCFVGWLHHDRLNQIQEIDHWSRKQGLSCFFYLYTGLFSKLRLQMQGKANFVKSKSIKFDDYVNLLHASSIIVDLPHPEQTGLTMRAIESIGAKKKLITSSKNIIQYEFYHSNNVFIVDPMEIVIDPSFITSSHNEVDELVVKKYSLKSWVRDVFEINQGID
jgi:hypothetical protein